MAVLKSGGSREQLQREIANLAARLIAEDGRDSGQARRKAAAQILGDSVRANGSLPDNEQVEAALREYLRTNRGDAHRVFLQRMRTLALEWMHTLAAFEPHLVGSVLNGSATEQSPVHLHLFTDSAKDVEIALLDLGLDIRVAPAENGQPHVQEVIGFLAPVPARHRGAVDAGTTKRARDTPPPATPILLTVLDVGALRFSPPAHVRRQDPSLGPIERSGRANRDMVQQLLIGLAGSAEQEAVHG
jgi:hypothetical protein